MLKPSPTHPVGWDGNKPPRQGASGCEPRKQEEARSMKVIIFSILSSLNTNDKRREKSSFLDRLAEAGRKKQENDFKKPRELLWGVERVGRSWQKILS